MGLVAAEESKFRLFGFVPDGVLVVDEQGLILYANPRAGTLFGVPPEALLGRPFEDLIGPSFHAALEFRALDEPGLRAVFVRDTTVEHRMEEARVVAADRAARLDAVAAGQRRDGELDTVASVILTRSPPSSCPPASTRSAPTRHC